MLPEFYLETLKIIQNKLKETNIEWFIIGKINSAL